MIRGRVTRTTAVIIFAVSAFGLQDWRATAALQEQARPTFRSGAAAVTVDASVRDRNGRPITGLSASNFTVLDNGVPQTVDEVSYGKVPIDVTVALDVSYSVSGRLLDRLRQGVLQLMHDLKPADRLKLVLFNMRVTRVTDFTNDAKLIDRAMRAAMAGGGTALLDAVSVTLADVAPPGRRQLNVYFTDGNDTSSTTPQPVVTAVAQRGRAALTFVLPVLDSIQPPTSVALAGQPVVLTQAWGVSRGPAVALRPLLDRLAVETGGSVIATPAAADLSATFSRALEQFRSAYVLYYTARNVEKSGYHTLQVTVDRKDATVQARRGYFGS